MRRLTAILVVAVGLAGCGRATQLTSSAAHPRSVLLAFSVREGGVIDNAPPVVARSRTMAMSLSRARVASVSCTLGAPLRSVGTVAPSVVTHWTALLDGARLAAIRSDPPGGAGRIYEFTYRGRTVRLQYARHVRRAPCLATECMDMMRIDATLRAVLPAATALSGFIATHCPVA